MTKDNADERIEEIQEGIDRSEEEIKRINNFFYDNNYFKTH